MRTLGAVRVGLPIAMLAVGIGLIVAGGEAADGAGVLIIGSGALVFALNALLRSSLREEDVRAGEEAARDHYREHGRWPGEDEPVTALPEPVESPPEAPHPGVRSIARPPAPKRIRRPGVARPPRRPRDE